MRTLARNKEDKPMTQNTVKTPIAKIVALFSALLIALTACAGGTTEETTTVLKGTMGGS